MAQTKVQLVVLVLPALAVLCTGESYIVDFTSCSHFEHEEKLLGQGNVRINGH